MLVKNTLVFLGSMFFLTHLNMLFIPILYASSVDSSTMSFTSSSKDPCLLNMITSPNETFPKQVRKQQWTNKLFDKRIKKLQDLELDPSHPPEIGVEHHNIGSFPVSSMFVYRTSPDDSIGYPVDDSIVRVWFKKEWCPVELNSCIVILSTHTQHEIESRWF